ncbi:hypothetical protein OEZ85_002675 [Tetradesmus obliquus]|uniref:Uncharacterized protein n=1 Tax=Tetradesmus obliquus TaxID=3088 RepID=A0ABY8U0X3_TETOB|nr:hypothetical protein OEZ85_002675 [Tetradesmus obliquus]
MTTHAYFNLNGHNSSTNITDHTVQLHSSYYTPVFNNTIVPTGEIAPVAGTPFDLRQPTLLSTVIEQVPGPDVPPGYDINMITPLGYPKATNLTQPSPRPVLVANISAPLTSITMGILTNAPGKDNIIITRRQICFQWYSGNHLPGPGEPQITGKGGVQYTRRGGFAVEPQGWPNAVQNPNFPSVIVNPGQIYEQQLVWEFGVQGGNATAGNGTPTNATAPAANATGAAATGNETAANASTPAANATEVPAAGHATAGNATASAANATAAPAAGPIVGSATEIGLDNTTAPVVANATVPENATPAVVVAPDVAGDNVTVVQNATAGNAAAGGGGAAP